MRDCHLCSELDDFALRLGEDHPAVVYAKQLNSVDDLKSLLFYECPHYYNANHTFVYELVLTGYRKYMAVQSKAGGIREFDLAC